MRLRVYYLLFSSFYISEGNFPPTSIPEAIFFSLSLYMMLARAGAIFILKLPMAEINLVWTDLASLGYQ